MTVKPATAPAAPAAPPSRPEPQIGATPAPSPGPSREAAMRPEHNPPTARDAGLPARERAMPLVDITGRLNASTASRGPLPGSGDPFAGAVRETVDKVAALFEDAAAQPQQDAQPPALPAETRQHVADRLAAWPEKAPERAQLQRAFASPAFAGLNADEQRKLIDYASGKNPISTGGRQELARLTADPKSTPDQLRNLLGTEPGLPNVVAALPSPAEPTRLEHRINGPTEVDHTFPSGASKANRYDVEIDGQTIPVFLSQTVEPKDGVMHSLDEVVKGLAALPASSRQLIKQVNMDGRANPSDAYWAQVYNDPGFRSYMTAGAAGVVDLYPTVDRQTQHACDASLIHETGHILSGRSWGPWQSDTRWAGWDEAAQKDGLVPSIYARSSRTEDFSEALTLYQLSKGTPLEAEYRAMFPARWAALDAVLAAPEPTR
jgi:hypothetical protein